MREPPSWASTAEPPLNSLESSSSPLPPGSAHVSALRFTGAAALATVVNLAANGGCYALILRDFYRAHPAGSEEFVRQLNRPPDQLVGWAMAVTSLTMGLFITVVMHWAGAKSARDGLIRGGVVGLLFWTSVNSGLYASSHVFSLASVIVDTPCSALAMTLGAVAAAWALGRGRSRGRSAA